MFNVCVCVWTQVSVLHVCVCAFMCVCVHMCVRDSRAAARLHASERSTGLAAESRGLRRQEIKHEMKTSSSLNILPSHSPISPLPPVHFGGGRETQTEGSRGRRGGKEAGVGMEDRIRG